MRPFARQHSSQHSYARLGLSSALGCISAVLGVRRPPALADLFGKSRSTWHAGFLECSRLRVSCTQHNSENYWSVLGLFSKIQTQTDLQKPCGLQPPEAQKPQNKKRQGLLRTRSLEVSTWRQKSACPCNQPLKPTRS